MIELNQELVRKHKDRLLEVTVKAHTATSKKGKVYNVKQYERHISARAKSAGMNQNHISKFNRLVRSYQRMLKHPDNDSEDTSMIKSDIRDVGTVFDNVMRGNFLAADRKLDYMDSSPRDDVWRVLGPVINRGLKKYHRSQYDSF